MAVFFLEVGKLLVCNERLRRKDWASSTCRDFYIATEEVMYKVGDERSKTL